MFLDESLTNIPFDIKKGTRRGFPQQTKKFGTAEIDYVSAISVKKEEPSFSWGTKAQGGL